MEKFRRNGEMEAIITRIPQGKWRWRCTRASVLWGHWDKVLVAREAASFWFLGVVELSAGNRTLTHFTQEDQFLTILSFSDTPWWHIWTWATSEHAHHSCLTQTQKEAGWAGRGSSAARAQPEKLTLQSVWLSLEQAGPEHHSSVGVDRGGTWVGRK